jgi:hypothetical protein
VDRITLHLTPTEVAALVEGMEVLRRSQDTVLIDVVAATVILYKTRKELLKYQDEINVMQGTIPAKLQMENDFIEMLEAVEEDPAIVSLLRMLALKYHLDLSPKESSV